MPAAIDGGKAFASRAVPAWHGLGTVFDADLDVSTSDMLDMAHLSGWNLRKVLAETAGIESYVSEDYHVVRDNPFNQKVESLGVVGSRYEVKSNEELFSFGDTLLDGGRWETAGAIKGGRQVFGSLALKDHDFILDPKGRQDRVESYLLVSTSHDGSLSVQASVTPVRVVCQNTLGVALKGATQKFKIRHTGAAGVKIMEARTALGITFDYLDAFAVEAEAMIEREITAAEFDSLIKAVYPVPEKDVRGALAKWTSKRDLIEAIYTGSADGPDTSNTQGTLWGAVNAMTERVDYYRKARAGNDEAIKAAASGFDLNAETERNRIFAAARVLLPA